MAFVHHEPCPSCHSRDNLARYADGGAFCFGCHYTERAQRYIPKSDVRKEYEKVPELSHDFPPDVVEWVSKYGLSLEEIIKRGVGYNASRHQLVFTLPNGCWQARNFWSGSKIKYFNQGNINDIIPIYSNGHDDGRLVVVEDCISAIKCARICDAMPILGSHIGLAKLSSLAKRYTTIVFWLDSDKYKEAQQQARAAELLGVQTKVVYTDLDPKEQTDETLRERLGASN